MGAAGIAAVHTDVATDVELVTAVRDGDDFAFEELYRRYHPRIAAFVRRHVRDAGRAEDVVQDSFMSALRRLRQTDSAIAFKPWIYEIARNASIDLYRRGSRAEEVSIDIEGGLAAADAKRLTGTGGPDASLLDKERFDHLRGALEELSETHHRIIVMRELEGLSYREIGERMELSQAAVESTLFRARRKLEYEYVQLDTGRRCVHMGMLIARLAEGFDSQRDRRRLDRHARRCSSCRCRARQLGVEPILERKSIASRAAALLPLPAFARRRLSGDAPEAGTAGVQQTAAAPVSVVVGPAADMTATVSSKAVAMIAAVALIGGGGAAVNGVGPLARGEHPTTGAGGGGHPASPSKDGLERRGTSGTGRGASGERGRIRGGAPGAATAPHKAAKKATPARHGEPAVPGLPVLPALRQPSEPPAGQPNGGEHSGSDQPGLVPAEPEHGSLIDPPQPHSGTVAAPDAVSSVQPPGAVQQAVSGISNS